MLTLAMQVFAVVSLWQAQERGLIGSVDDAINLTEPSFQVRNRFTDEPLTWRMLACQLSGLPREAPCGLVDCDYTNTEMLEILKDVSTMFPAWLRPSYSNLVRFAVVSYAKFFNRDMAHFSELARCTIASQCRIGVRNNRAAA